MNDHRTMRSTESVFTDIYRKHWLAVLGYAVRRAARPEDAADVVAETFGIAWRRLGDIPAEPDTRPWLIGVARKALANQNRSTFRRGALIERLRDQVIRIVPTSTDSSESDEAVRDSLNSLDPLDRELLTLTIWEGFSPGEVALALQMSPGTVRSRLHRARRTLRGLLESDLTSAANTPHTEKGTHQP